MLETAPPRQGVEALAHALRAADHLDAELARDGRLDDGRRRKDADAVRSERLHEGRIFELADHARRTGHEASNFVAGAALRALTTEGLPAARVILRATTNDPTTRRMRQDLAFAAGDCDMLVSQAMPLVLADGESLLYAGACLTKAQRHGEAIVFFEAARVYAAADVDPALEDLIELAHESATWWQKNAARARAFAANEVPGT